jgi:hypothetical protein
LPSVSCNRGLNAAKLISPWRASKTPMARRTRCSSVASRPSSAFMGDDHVAAPAVAVAGYLVTIVVLERRWRRQPAIGAAAAQPA